MIYVFQLASNRNTLVIVRCLDFHAACIDAGYKSKDDRVWSLSGVCVENLQSFRMQPVHLERIIVKR